MASELSDALKSLSTSAERLNSLTDEATAAVLGVEKFLSKLSLGIESHVPFGERAVPRSNVVGHISSVIEALRFDHRSLGYQRVGKDRQYRIVFRDFDGKTLTWSELPRDLKIESVAVLPNLVRRIAHEVQNRVTAAESALAEVSQILPKLEQSLGGIDNA